jgi:hypothetical protein
MSRKKIRAICGLITNDFTVIGLGWSSKDSSLIFVLLNLYIGLQFSRKRSNKPVKTMSYVKKD